MKQIIEIINIKESTLRYHKQNIDGKLGVHSLKQLLQYAASMKESQMHYENLAAPPVISGGAYYFPIFRTLYYIRYR